MKFILIIFVLILCILITLFLVRESYTSEKSKKVSLMITLMSVIVTVISTLFSNSLSNNVQNINIGNSIVDRDEMIINKEQFITFNGLPCFILSKNFEDTIINNINSEFIFYNHPENEGSVNTLTFSFDLNQKYNYFSSCIGIKDNINNENLKTVIQIHADDLLVYSSGDLCSNSLPLYIDLDLSDISILSFSVNTNMIDADSELYRTITFSDIILE